jgi:hypothetical protein
MLTTPFGAYGLNIAILLVSIMLTIGGIALGIGYAVNIKKFKEFGKDEIIQSLINGALVGGLLLLFVNSGVMDSLINSIALGNGTQASCSNFLSYNSAICFAYNYLVGSTPYYFMGAPHNSILTSIMGLIMILLPLYATLGLLKTFLSPLLSQIQSAVQALSAAAVSVTVQASVLAFIAVSALTIILPLGLILRSFYPTRKTGGFLIALAICLYVVFPLTYVMNATISNSYLMAANETGSSAVAMTTEGITSSVTSLANQGLNNASVLSLIGGFGSWIASLLNGIFSDVGNFIVYAFIMPAFSLVITGISVRELSRILGSEVPIGRLKLL